MDRLFFSTGQAARQLNTTLATMRLLCENQVIAAETTPGGQWRVPASEVERLKRDGLPPIPRPLPPERTPQATNLPVPGRDHMEPPPKPSEPVMSAADQVAITRSLLERRRVEREIEENEDWFRERERQQAAVEAIERKKIEAAQAVQKRLLWIQHWTEYALNSVPSGARREVEIEVHAAVATALSELQPNHADAIIQRLVDAAVHRALKPWKQDIERALKTAMNRLPWEMGYESEYAPLKQRAWNAAVEGLGRLREEATYYEMETAAVQAVRPMIQEYTHHNDCQRMVRRVFVFGISYEEQKGAQDEVRKGLAALPIGTPQKELEKVRDAAIASYKAALDLRKEKELRELEKQERQYAAERRADLHLGHIVRHLKELFEYTRDSAMRCDANRLRPLVREALIEDLLEDPSMSDDDIRYSIETVIEENK